MLVAKIAKTVTNILSLSPTHYVSNIRHQHQCYRVIISRTLFQESFHITIFSDLPFKTAALHGVFFVLSRYSSTIAVTVLLDKFSIRFWTTLSVTCLGVVGHRLSIISRLNQSAQVLDINTM